MRAVYAHFPINVRAVVLPLRNCMMMDGQVIIADNKNSVEIRNFLGEKVRKPLYTLV